MGKDKKRGSSSSSSSSSSSDSEGGGSSSPRRDERKNVEGGNKAPEEESRVENESANKNSSEADGKNQPEGRGPSLMERTKMLPAGRAGGAYIPPFRLKQMQAGIQDKSSVEYQRMTWEALKKSINGLINKVTKANITSIVQEIFQENLVRGRGLYCRSLMKAQLASPNFTNVYAALTAVINTKLPENGETLLKRVIMQFRRSYKRNDKPVCTAMVKFIAHLINQQVAHEILGLQLLTVLLEKPTDDSVELAVSFVKEAGSALHQLTPMGLHAIFERFRGVLHEGEIDKRVQYMIEGLFAVRKTNFAEFPALDADLDLVDADDQITHELSLDDQLDPEPSLDIFHPDPEFVEHEEAWKSLKKELLGEEEGGEEGDDEEEEEEEEEEEDEEEAAAQQQEIQDQTETDLVNLRRTIYLTIQSSMQSDEAAHKLLKLQIKPGQEKEMLRMIIECGMQEKSYMKYYGVLAERFCKLKKEWEEMYDELFAQYYATVHRLETNKLRNVAKIFGHLLHTDAMPWTCLEYIRLNEEETTSSSRIFIKILFQEVSEYMGLPKLKERLEDPFMAQYFEGLFPRDNPRNTRFAINFFTSIGLGGLTEGLREHLKNLPKMIMQRKQESSSSSSSSSSTSSSSRSGLFYRPTATEYLN